MNRKKSNRKPAPKRNHGTSSGSVAADPAPSKAEGGHRRTPAASASLGPSPGIQTTLSIWLVFHLFAIAVSFTSVVEPSSIHASVASILYPYLRIPHFGADDRPVYLAYDETSERPHRVQVTTASLEDANSIDDVRWRRAGPAGAAGFAVSDRVARWLSTVAILADNEEPSLVAELLLPIVKNDETVNTIRIIRMPSTPNDRNAEVESPYVARVIRNGDVVSLVQLNPARLSSKAVSDAATQTGGSDQ